MAKRIAALEKAEHVLMSRGLPGLGIRIVDHGLAGAMLLLQAATMWYEISLALPNDPPTNKLDLSVWKCFKERPNESRIEIDPKWYWNGLLWATAAVAFHNIAQCRWPGASNPDELKVSLDDDVLTYMGILVDILEEWDRYTMSRDSIFVGDAHLPVQAKDVRIGMSKSGRIVVKYPTKKTADKVRKGLNSSLSGWSEIVEIRQTRKK